MGVRFHIVACDSETKNIVKPAKIIFQHKSGIVEVILTGVPLFDALVLGKYPHPAARNLPTRN